MTSKQKKTRQDYMLESLEKLATEFREFSKDTRDDFHEPDEQEIELLSIVGNCLDNAFGTSVNVELLQLGRQEVVIFLNKRTDEGDTVSYKFNLADIFALAKAGAAAILEKQHG